MKSKRGANAGNTGQKHSYLLFVVSGRHCAAPSTRIREVVHIPELMKPPGMPSIIEGMMRFGEDIVVVFRPDRLLKLEEPEIGLYTPLLLLDDATLPAALLVEEVIGLVEFADDDLVPVDGEETFNSCVTAQGYDDERVVFMIDVDRLLLEEEKCVMADFRQRTAERLRDAEAAGH